MRVIFISMAVTGVAGFASVVAFIVADIRYKKMILKSIRRKYGSKR